MIILCPLLIYPHFILSFNERFVQWCVIHQQHDDNRNLKLPQNITPPEDEAKFAAASGRNTKINLMSNTPTTKTGLELPGGIAC